MKELRFTVDAENKNTRIDKYIAIKLGEAYSRTFVKTLMDNGFIRVNGADVKPRYIAQERDKVLVQIPPQKKSCIEAENIPLNILYEDEWIIVVDKPAGMVVHPGAGNKKGTLVNALLYHCGNLPAPSEVEGPAPQGPAKSRAERGERSEGSEVEGPASGDEARPGIVHRLDKDTSGVLVAAKNDRALRSLSKQFQKRAVKKRYTALVKGHVEFDNGTVEAPVARHAVNRQKMDVRYQKGKNARTRYHVVKRFDNFTMLELEPETGRTHQIRVHMKHIGHPVLGDKTYGENSATARQALHAEMLGFSHPDTGKYMEFHSPLPDDIMKIVKKHGLEDTAVKKD